MSPGWEKWDESCILQEHNFEIHMTAALEKTHTEPGWENH